MPQRYNPPPNWPQPPAGWTPPPGWRPDPSWGPPPPGWQLYTDSGSWASRNKPAAIVLGVIGAIVLLSVLGSALGGSEPTASSPATTTTRQAPAATAGETTEETTEAPETTTRAPATTTTTTTAAPAAAGVGTAVRDGDLEFTVTGFECGLTSVSDNTFADPPQGEFCLATVTSRNTSTKPANFTGGSQKLIGAGGTQYEVDGSASIFVTDANAIFEPINPGNSLTSKLIFDVPVGSPVTALELHDSILSRGAKVSVTR